MIDDRKKKQGGERRKLGMMLCYALIDKINSCSGNGGGDSSWVIKVDVITWLVPIKK